MKRLFAPVFVLVFVAACTTTPLDVFNTAQTPAQKAFALYGTFVVTEEAAAEIVTNPKTPAVVIRVIKKADAVAKPAADTMLVAARAYVSIDARFDAGEPGIQLSEVKATFTELKDAIARAGPAIGALVRAVQNIRE